jgi:hypothetical protein
LRRVHQQIKSRVAAHRIPQASIRLAVLVQPPLNRTSAPRNLACHPVKGFPFRTPCAVIGQASDETLCVLDLRALLAKPPFEFNTKLR